MPVFLITALQRGFVYLSAVSGVCRRCGFYLFADNQASVTAVGQGEIFCPFVLCAQLFYGCARPFQFPPSVAFHGNKITAHLYQRYAVFRQHPQVCHRTGCHHIIFFSPGFSGRLFCPFLYDAAFDVQAVQHILQKCTAFSGGFYQGQVYIRPENEAYLGLDMRINSIPGQLRYRVTFSSQMRRMGADMTSEGLRTLLSEVGQTYALLTALESRSYTPTTEDLTAFREELLAEQEAKSFQTLRQMI